MTGTRTGVGYHEVNALLVRAGERPDAPVELTDDEYVWLQARWTTELSSALDQALEFPGPVPLTAAVAGAWRRLAARHGTLRRVLDASAHRPGRRELLGREYAMLAMAAGLTQPDTPVTHAMRLGRDYRELVRAGVAFSSASAGGPGTGR